MLNITEVNIVPRKPDKGFLAFASAIIDGIYHGNMAIYSRPNGDLRVIYPTKKLKNGRQIQIFHPINKEVDQEIHKALIGAYLELTENQEQKEPEVKQEDEELADIKPA
ncbi:MAG: septation protein SpoVG family protein [Candidatus Omnitrophota bacterium]